MLEILRKILIYIVIFRRNILRLKLFFVYLCRERKPEGAESL